MEKRISEIDIAKGIGIILVMALHTKFHQPWLSTFEMPLFFFLSGCCFNLPNSFKKLFLKKVNTILIPYIFFELPKLIYDLVYAFTHENTTILYSCMNSAIPTTTWFLLSLFEIQLLSYFLIKFNKIIILLIGFSISFFGFLLSKYNIYNLLYINSSLSCLIYFLCGHTFKNKINEWLSKPQSAVYQCLIGGGCLMACFLLWNIDKPIFSHAQNILPDNYIIMLLTALFGIVAILIFSKAIKHSSVLQFYGRNSLIILGVHLYYILVYNEIFGTTNTLVLFVSCILSVIPVIFVFKRFFSKFCGVKPLIKIRGLL